MFSYGQRSKCADLLNSYHHNTFRAVLVEKTFFRSMQNPKMSNKRKFFCFPCNGICHSHTKQHQNQQIAYFVLHRSPEILCSNHASDLPDPRKTYRNCRLLIAKRKYPRLPALRPVCRTWGRTSPPHSVSFRILRKIPYSFCHSKCV